MISDRKFDAIDRISSEFHCPPEIAEVILEGKTDLLCVVRHLGPARVQWVGNPKNRVGENKENKQFSCWSLDGRRMTIPELELIGVDLLEKGELTLPSRAKQMEMRSLLIDQHLKSISGDEDKESLNRKYVKFSREGDLHILQVYDSHYLLGKSRKLAKVRPDSRYAKLTIGPRSLWIFSLMYDLFGSFISKENLESHLRIGGYGLYKCASSLAVRDLVDCLQNTRLTVDYQRRLGHRLRLLSRDPSL